MALSLPNGSDGTVAIANSSKPLAAAAPPGMKIGDDFPMVCEPCLGENPYIRMVKTTLGRQCQISKRPFTSFTWRTSSGRRKDTIICYQVAAEKNICQCCLCDMDYGLPVGVRDAFLASMDSNNGDGVALIPTSESNQANYYARKAALVAQGEDPTTGGSSGGYGQAHSQQLLQAVRGAVQTNQDGPKAAQNRHVNLPRLCSAWLNGNCSRVSSGKCPFRPCCGANAFPELAGELEATSEISKLIRENGPTRAMKLLSNSLRQLLRNHLSQVKPGVAGPVRSKHIKDSSKTKRTLGGDSGGSKPQANATLVIIGIFPGSTEGDLGNVFEGYGEIIRYQLLPAKKCAFVQFAQREDAKTAIEDLQNSCIIRGKVCKVSWATPKNKKSSPTPQPVAYKPPPAPAKPSPKEPPQVGLSAGSSLPAAPKGLKAFVIQKK